MMQNHTLANRSRTIPEDYIEKVYAGWLGKVIGVRHGGNVEGWTYEQLERTFGEITGYLHQFKHFAADDDTNGPMFFLRALQDYTHTGDITSEQMGLTWLNYAPDGHGFFWWGGYGKSTENTAYINLKNGIMAPRSGSIQQNGTAVAEQIGGQIFIDVWGLIAPGSPELAAEYAEKIARVSHDGEGKYGGMFIAACIAKAFNEQDVVAIIEAGLSVIPVSSEYTRMVRAVMDFHLKHPEHWRDCFRYVKDNFGYDRYPGVCHIIPNSAVIVLSLLYSNGDFSQAINICNMCGWDTDCNVANVGTIMGVRGGLDGIEWRWREPINDFLCCSSVIGSMNMLDIPWCAAYIAYWGFRIAGTEPPKEWREMITCESSYFHFEYPGSTHGFEMDCDTGHPVTAKAMNSNDMAASGSRSLKVVFDRAQSGLGYRAFHRTYMLPDDFNDSRYDPSFSPKLYPGMVLSTATTVHPEMSQRIQARLYVRDRNSGTRMYGEKKTIKPGIWENLKFAIPPMENVCLIEAGIEWIPEAGSQQLIGFIDDFRWSGLPDYEIDFSREHTERWTAMHIDVSQLSALRGMWTLEDGKLNGRYFGETAEIYTGLLEWRNYTFSSVLTPIHGEHHRIMFRVQGGIRSYAAGFAPGGKIVILKNNNGYEEIASLDFHWQQGQTYTLTVEVKDQTMTLRVDGQEYLSCVDKEAPYVNGMIGFSNAGGSHTQYHSFRVKGIEGSD